MSGVSVCVFSRLMLAATSARLETAPDATLNKFYSQYKVGCVVLLLSVFFFA